MFSPPLFFSFARLALPEWGLQGQEFFFHTLHIMFDQSQPYRAALHTLYCTYQLRFANIELNERPDAPL